MSLHADLDFTSHQLERQSPTPLTVTTNWRETKVLKEDPALKLAPTGPYTLRSHLRLPPAHPRCWRLCHGLRQYIMRGYLPNRLSLQEYLLCGGKAQVCSTCHASLSASPSACLWRVLRGFEGERRAMEFTVDDQRRFHRGATLTRSPEN